jgi:hypothetical protein
VGPHTKKVGSSRSVGGVHGLLICSRVFLTPRWMMLEEVLGVGALSRWLYLATKPSHVRVDVDGLSYPLHYPYDL